MRIVAGEWRGRKIVAPPGRETRPTSDRVREALFSVAQSLLLSGRLQPVVPAWAGCDPETGTRARGEAEGPGSAPDWSGEAGGPGSAPAGPLAGFVVMDLYAGSGAVGLEALSRGAAACTFVEAARPAAAALRRNVATLGVRPDRARILVRQADAVLRDEVAAGRRYTLVFADPPYAAYAEQEGSLATSLPELLSPGGLVVVETARRVEPHLPLVPLTAKLYGDTRVTFLGAPD
jgi:16S rRNA (guanine966-N2)-methyltransferase